MAAPHGVVRQVRDVDRHQIHRDAARDRAALAGNHDLGAAASVIGAGCAEISVGIAGRDDCEFRRPSRGPGAAIADRLTALDVPDLYDAGLELDHRPHRVVGLRCWIDAIERSARAHQIELELRSEENARRVRQRRRHIGEKRCDRAEGGELPGIRGTVQLLGAGKVAHHQRNAVVAGIDPRHDALRFRHAEAEPVHAGIDMNGGAPIPTGTPAKYVPLGELIEIADDRPCVDPGIGLAGVLEEAIEHVDRGRRRYGCTDGCRFIQRGDKERLAPGIGERTGNGCGAATIGVRLDHAGTFRRYRGFLQLPPIGDDGVEVDRENAGGGRRYRPLTRVRRERAGCRERFRIGSGVHASSL